MLRAAHQDRALQGRVPAWNLAGLLPPDPTSPGPGGASPGSVSSSLAHPLPHYSGAYGTQHPSHYSHLLPPQSTESSSPTAHQWHPPNMETASGPTSTSGGASTTPGMHYKMDPDAMTGMYYPHQPNIGPTSTDSGTATSSSSTPVTTSASSDSLLHVPNFTISATSVAASIEPQDINILHQYLGSTGAGAAEMPAISEEGASWFDPSHQAAAAAAAAAANHHLDPYHLEFGPRVGQHPQDRKKKIIKEWQAGKPGTNGTSTSEVSAAAAAAAAARGFVDFPGYDPGNPIHYPYAYPDVNPLVNPWHHHHSLHGHHHPQHSTQHLQGAQMGGSVVGVPAHSMATSAGSSTVGIAGPSGHSAAMSKRERKRKIAAADAATAAAMAAGLPPGVNMSQMTRDERRALALSLPISCHEIINLPMDEFNDLLSKHELSEEQLTLCRDIRRRGKNKVAARNCRKRKIDQIKQLEEDVQRIRCRKTELLQEHDQLLNERSRWSDKVKRMHDYVLKELGHNPSHWQLQMDANRQVHILPRSHADEHEQAKMEARYHYAPSLGPPLMEGTIPTPHHHHPGLSHR